MSALFGGSKHFLLIAALVTMLSLPLVRQVRADETDPIGVHIQLVIADAWADATRTWAQLLGEHVYNSDIPRLNFVPKVSASHCYGLYINPGPVYCSGNATVFVSVAAMEDIGRRYPQLGDAGLAFLVAHELGHHVQKVTGRFGLLSRLVRSEPERRREFARRFELEADCLAGVWASRSERLAAADEVQKTMLRAIEGIGDDRVLSAAGQRSDPSQFLHGSAEQRTSWFERGWKSGEISSCDVLRVATP